MSKKQVIKEGLIVSAMVVIIIIFGCFCVKIGHNQDLETLEQKQNRITNVKQNYQNFKTTRQKNSKSLEQINNTLTTFQ